MIACGNMAIRLTITVTTAARKGSELAQLYKAPRTKRRVVMAGFDRWRERCVMVDSRCSLPAALLRSLSDNLQSFLAIAYRLPRLKGAHEPAADNKWSFCPRRDIQQLRQV